MDVTREHTSCIMELREILLSFQTGFSLVSAAVLSVLSCTLRLRTLISFDWAKVLEACDCLKLLSIHFDLCVNATGDVGHQLGLLCTDLHAVGCGGSVKMLNWICWVFFLSCWAISDDDGFISYVPMMMIPYHTRQCKICAGTNADVGSHTGATNMRSHTGPAPKCARGKKKIALGQPVYTGAGQYEISRKVHLCGGFWTCSHLKPYKAMQLPCTDMHYLTQTCFVVKWLGILVCVWKCVSVTLCMSLSLCVSAHITVCDSHCLCVWD